MQEWSDEFIVNILQVYVVIHSMIVRISWSMTISIERDQFGQQLLAEVVVSEFISFEDSTESYCNVHHVHHSEWLDELVSIDYMVHDHSARTQLQNALENHLWSSGL